MARKHAVDLCSVAAEMGEEKEKREEDGGKGDCIKDGAALKFIDDDSKTQSESPD